MKKYISFIPLRLGKHGLHKLKNNFGLIKDQSATKELPIMFILTGTRGLQHGEN
jgi:hypothetical protein